MYTERVNIRSLILICVGLLWAAALTACGGAGETTGPPEPTGPRLAVLQDFGETATVTDTLPFKAEVEIERDGKPVADQLVDWVVLEDDCGTAFVSTTRTNQKGITKNGAVAGTRAHTRISGQGVCPMQVRWVEQTTGDLVRDTTITYLVQPGEPVVGDQRKDHSAASGGGLAGDSPHTLAIDVFAAAVYDRYGNPVVWGIEPLDHLTSEEADDRFGGLRRLVASSEGCAPFYVRTDGGHGVKADSGVAFVERNNVDGSFSIELQVGDMPWSPSSAQHEECVAPYL